MQTYGKIVRSSSIHSRVSRVIKYAWTIRCPLNLPPPPSVVVVAINGDSSRDGCSRFDWSEIQDYSGDKKIREEMLDLGGSMRERIEDRDTTRFGFLPLSKDKLSYYYWLLIKQRIANDRIVKEKRIIDQVENRLIISW